MIDTIKLITNIVFWYKFRISLCKINKYYVKKKKNQTKVIRGREKTCDGKLKIKKKKKHTHTHTHTTKSY